MLKYNMYVYMFVCMHVCIVCVCVCVAPQNSTLLFICDKAENVLVTGTRYILCGGVASEFGALNINQCV
jgi:hypothetical protein